ncbi:MAG TPA: TIGR00730 family Rossman fold protein [Armatimonadota bacterium]|nr:TIGR00730 family Rossman fold protein [Armatimonadota bacterium]
MPGNIDEVKRQIQRTLEQYFTLEAELKLLEKDHFRVCIFGSARIRPEDPTYQRVYETAKLLAELDIDIVTGGGPGLMEAANRGVHDAHNGESRSIGLTIDLPRSDELANKHLDIKSEHKRFSSRLDEFMRLSHAVIVAPGGIGTTLELMYVWQLIQVGMIEERPVVLMDRSFWTGLLEWMREELLGRGFVSARDFDWIHCVDTPEEVLPFIKAELVKFRAAQEKKPEGAAHAAQASEMIQQVEKKQSEAGV